MSDTLDTNADLLGDAPSPPAEQPPVDNAYVQPGCEQFEGKPEIDFSVRKRQYTPCTGKQISTFLKAVELGMKDAHYASEGEVSAFVNSKGA